MPYTGNKPSAVPLTSADIADSIITTAKIADGAVVNADIANSTINLTTKVTGTLPVANGGTGLAALGTSLQVLRTNTGATALEYATLSTGATAGQVIQVITATDSTARGTTSSSFVTASNTLSVTITPSSASNKIFVIVSTSIYFYEDGYVTIKRGSTDLGAASNCGLIYINSNQGAGYSVPTMGQTMSILDSPSTTSATTYQVYFRRGFLTSGGGSGALQDGSAKGTITCFEIKG
jgi:hypothetical protein